jgi:signal transduction histidine kinase
MRVRKKVLVLHTLFSLGLAAVLLIPLRPAIMEVVEQAEGSEARAILRQILAEARDNATAEQNADRWAAAAPDAQVRRGSSERLSLPPSIVAAAAVNPGQIVPAMLDHQQPGAVVMIAPDEFWAVGVRIGEARRAVWELYGLTAAALLAVYALVAAALELFVLPQHVYGPIQRMIDADRAIEDGDEADELISEQAIPADELGELMRSRNRAILAIRGHERALGEALKEIERVANDLKRKNHLLEAAQRNLADADRLASLGMMSAGIAHELNTPLAVVKGLAERLNANPTRSLDPASASLLLRVVSRIERLGESLLDFARVRPPRTARVPVRGLVDDAMTLLRLDRDLSAIEISNGVDAGLHAQCDADRMVQVLVNLTRNAADAIGAVRARVPSGSISPDRKRDERAPRQGGRISIDAELVDREAQAWVSLTITDDGPGIDPEILPRLFEPFASTRLDAHGTGLGLAVAEGIVREHGGLILARNMPLGGAQFEIMLPAIASSDAHVAAREQRPDAVSSDAAEVQRS